MNIQEMISKMDPKKIEDGLKNMSGMLTPEQMNQMKSVMENFNTADLKNIDVNKIQSELKNSPDVMKQLQNPDLMKKVTELFKK